MKKYVIALAVFLAIVLQGEQAFACSPTWPWLGYPKQIDCSQGSAYEVIPGVRLYSPRAALVRSDVFPPDVKLTQEINIKAAAVESVYGDGLDAVKDVLQRLSEKIGKDKVQEFMNGVSIYLLPSMDFAKSYATVQGEPDLKVKGFYVAWMKEIWINADAPPNAWKNSLVHEIGHRYDYYIEEQTGLKASRELYSDYYRVNAAKDYFNALRWFEDPSEWFAEAFKILYGYPGLKGYRDADEIFERRQPGAKAQIMRGIEFLSKNLTERGLFTAAS